MSARPSVASAYVHVPFCRHRCGYCNFTLVAGRDDLIGDYLRAVECELNRLTPPADEPLATLYLGGGTPSHLPLSALDHLLRTLRRSLPILPACELTIEANPSDVTPDFVALLSAHGINRVSLGAQSFSAGRLALLERDHGAETIRRAVELIRRSIDNISLDLIFGIPGESLADWQDDVRLALQLHPSHLSCYGLTYEKGTTYWTQRHKGQLQPVGEELERSMYEWVIDHLSAAGWHHYEVSNFARPGYRSRHNTAYWQGESYYGIGPGAASYVHHVRQLNHRSTHTYLRRVLSGQSPVVEREQLSEQDRARERLIFGLRQIDGINTGEFIQQTGHSVQALAGDVLRRFEQLGLLHYDPDTERLRLTRAGLMVSDSIWPELL